MRRLGLIPLVVVTSLLLNGCWWNTVYITKCPAAEIIPVIEYKTDAIPEKVSSALVIKWLMEDLVSCQATEQQLRTVLTGYK